MINEFKNFIAKGNVMDMAVGIIIGAAFTAIVTSLVGDIINPLIALFTGGMDFSGWFYELDFDPEQSYSSIDAATAAGVAVFAIGKFVMAVINFLIVAFVVFLLVKMVNRLKDAAMKKDEAAPAAEEPKGPTAEALLMEIRDALQARG